MADITREISIKQLSDIRFQFQSSMDEADVDKDCREAYEDNKATVNAIDFAISDMKRVEDLYGYVDDAIEAEKRMMGRILDLASEEYHKGIIYALERMKMKLME